MTRACASDPDAARSLTFQIAFLLVFQTLLFWAFPYFPSQDGPAHLNTAAVLSGLSAGDTLYQQIYSSAWQFESNQLYHALLILLGQFMPFLTAEKLILSTYGVAFTASVWYLIRSVHGRPEAVLLAMPVVFTGVLYLGFFNSCLAFVAGIWSLGIFFKLQERFTWKRTFSLACALLLTYFLHIFVLLILLPAMLLIGISRYIAWSRFYKNEVTIAYRVQQRSARAPVLASLVAAIPSIVLVVLFLATTNESASADSTSLLKQSSDVASFKGFRIISKAYHALITFSLLDVLVRLPWIALLTGVTVSCLKTKGDRLSGYHNSKKAFNHSYLWVAFAAVLLLLLVMPINSGPIVLLDSRLSPFLFVALTLWLSTGALTNRQWHCYARLALIIVAMQLIYRFAAHANLNADIAEYVQVQERIPAQTSLLTVEMELESHGFLALGGQHLQFNHMMHAGGYLVLEKSLVNIRNYQLGYPYFPIRFKPGVKLTMNKPIWDKTTFDFDFSAAELASIPMIETVTLWDNLTRTESSRSFESLQSVLRHHGFVESYVSSPRGLARVYSR